MKEPFYCLLEGEVVENVMTGYVSYFDCDSDSIGLATELQICSSVKIDFHWITDLYFSENEFGCLKKDLSLSGNDFYLICNRVEMNF